MRKTPDEIRINEMNRNKGFTIRLRKSGAPKI